MEWAASLKGCSRIRRSGGAVLPVGHRERCTTRSGCCCRPGPGPEVRHRRARAWRDRDRVGQYAHLPGARVPRRAFLLAVIASRPLPPRGLSRTCRPGLPADHLFCRVLLLLSFALLAQRRVLSLIHLFTVAGITLVASDLDDGLLHRACAPVLLAGLTFVLKVLVIPWLLPPPAEAPSTCGGMSSRC